MHYIEQQILRLDAEIAQRLVPYQKEYELLQTIPGIAQTSAAAVPAEIGSDMSAFADGDHLALVTPLLGSPSFDYQLERAGHETNVFTSDQNFLSTTGKIPPILSMRLILNARKDTVARTVVSRSHTFHNFRVSIQLT